jgi:hypothetical protein
MVALLKMPRIEPEESWADRRMFERTPAQGVAQGHRLDHTLQARRNPRLTLNLRDLSLGGLSALANDPLEQGESVAVTFPQRGLNPGWNASGRVIRCRPSPCGYQVAIEFEPLLAA